MQRRSGSGSFTPRRAMRLLLAVSALAVTVAPPVSASPSEIYSGPHFGRGNYPAECAGDFVRGTSQFWYVPGEGGLLGGTSSSDAVCHHMRTNMNYLDSPQIDVLILVPATEPERSMRLARESVLMWEGGIDYLSEQMGLDWLAEGVDFHITVDQVDVGEADGDGEFTTYPIVDPELVVVQALNAPGATLGIGTDPVGLNACHGIQNPFDIEAWKSLPGFDSHHDGRSGTFVEDCGGAGGNTCYAINTTGDTSVVSWNNMFDLVSHEVGHCLSIGHVGDGAEGAWGGLPPDDIMAYSDGGPGTSCVSTLNVEGFALRMSHHLDVNGDGAVDPHDHLEANDQSGGFDGDGDPFQVMHPDDYAFASGTGAAIDCPQPDSGLLPGARTDWTPAPVDRQDGTTLTVTSPADGAENQTGDFTVAGTVARATLPAEVPTSPVASHDDADADATSPITEILDLNLEVTETHLTAALRLADLVMPSPGGASATGYNLVVDGHEFESFAFGFGASQVQTWDATAGVYVNGYSRWDTVTKTVSFTIPRAYLDGFDVDAPYEVASNATVGGIGGKFVTDDSAPDGSETLGVAGPEWVPTSETVQVYAGDVNVGSQSVDTSDGAADFVIALAPLAEGTHALRIEWAVGDSVLASSTRTVAHDLDDDDDRVPNVDDACEGADDALDSDGDGVPDGCDVCAGSDDNRDADSDGIPNACDADLDGDGIANENDADRDGDGWSNTKEKAQKTDPDDPASFPTKGRR